MSYFVFFSIVGVSTWNCRDGSNLTRPQQHTQPAPKAFCFGNLKPRIRLSSAKPMIK